MSYQILRNERIEERENRHGSIRSRSVLTWDVVHDGVLYRECKTRKEAVSEAKGLNATLTKNGMTPIAGIRRKPV